MKPIFKHYDQVAMFRATLSAETDRGVALVCAAYLSEELRALLEKTFVDDPTTIDKLFEGTGALGTFSARIDLAYVSGQLPTDCRRALHLIRKIRNDFAHLHQEKSFRDQEMAARCRELISLNPFADEQDPRKLYVRATMMVLAEIHATTHCARRPEVKIHGSLDSLRPEFLEMRKTLDDIMANLTREDVSRLLSLETAPAAKKHLIVELLNRHGVIITEQDLG